MENFHVGLTPYAFGSKVIPAVGTKACRAGGTLKVTQSTKTFGDLWADFVIRGRLRLAVFSVARDCFLWRRLVTMLRAAIVEFAALPRRLANLLPGRRQSAR
jgi:hypothetical protein